MENQTKQMLFVYLGSLLAFKIKNILMCDQQIINIDCSSGPQRHLDINIRRNRLAECVLRKLPSQA